MAGHEPEAAALVDQLGHQPVRVAPGWRAVWRSHARPPPPPKTPTPTPAHPPTHLPPSTHTQNAPPVAPPPSRPGSYVSDDLQRWSLASVLLSWQQIQGFPGSDRPYGHLDAPPPPYRIERPKARATLLVLGRGSRTPHGHYRQLAGA